MSKKEEREWKIIEEKITSRIKESAKSITSINKCIWNMNILNRITRKQKICLLVALLFIVLGWIFSLFSLSVLGDVIYWLGLGILWGNILSFWRIV